MMDWKLELVVLPSRTWIEPRHSTLRKSAFTSMSTTGPGRNFALCR